MPFGGAWRQGREGPPQIQLPAAWFRRTHSGWASPQPGFPLSGNLLASFLPCDVTAPVICPTLSASLLLTGQAGPLARACWGPAGAPLACAGCGGPFCSPGGQHWPRPRGPTGHCPVSAWLVLAARGRAPAGPQMNSQPDSVSSWLSEKSFSRYSLAQPTREIASPRSTDVQLKLAEGEPCARSHGRFLWQSRA